MNEKNSYESFLEQRRAGILLHVTSLPSSLGLGTLGKQANRFIDFLHETDISVWQMLPIHPLHRVPLNTPYRNFLSPYQPMSAFAGNPMFVNLKKLMQRNWLPMQPLPKYAVEQIEYAFDYRRNTLKEAYRYFSQHASDDDQQAFQNFVNAEKDWLKDYALFCGLKDFYNGVCWWNWKDKGHRNHDAEALERFQQRQDKKYCLEQYYFEQFAFFTQWQELKEQARQKGVYLFGDMPHFMAYDSVDVWAHRDYFLLDDNGIPQFISGSPPENDFFDSRYGQRWGHPLYHWDKHQQDGFQWWLQRFAKMEQLFDMVRLTHFKGFCQCWAVAYPEHGPDARIGEWQSVPGEALFSKLKDRNFSMELLAEDIGATADSEKLRQQFDFFSMKLLQLAFDLDNNSSFDLTNHHLPHRHYPRDVVYTGTHDSNTTVGWFKKIKPKPENEKLQFVCNYLLDANKRDMPWPMIQAALQSVAKLAVIPMQDILSLDSEARINQPSRSRHKNLWRWQLDWQLVKPDIQTRLKKLVQLYERKG